MAATGGKCGGAQLVLVLVLVGVGCVLTLCLLCFGRVCIWVCVVGSGLLLWVRIVYVFCLRLVGAMSICCVCVVVGLSC